MRIINADLSHVSAVSLCQVNGRPKSLLEFLRTAKLQSDLWAHFLSMCYFLSFESTTLLQFKKKIRYLILGIFPFNYITYFCYKNVHIEVLISHNYVSGDKYI